MDPLATLVDLSNRDIDVSNATLANTMLAVASAAVRGAAGSPISRETSTVTYTGWRHERYVKLAGLPVVSVGTVTVDGDAVTDWRLSGQSRLWRLCGWGVDDGPADVVVIQTHGLLVVPEDIVNLVCSYAAAGIAAAAEGFASHAGVVTERIDDYSVTWAQGAEAIASVMELPEGTRCWLAGMFGGSAAMVTTQS